MSWCQVHSGTCDQILFSVWKLLCCLCLVHCQRVNVICIVHVTCFKYMQYILDLCKHRLSTADHANIYATTVVFSKSKSHYDRRSVGQFVLVSCPFWSTWLDVTFIWMTITFFSFHVGRPLWRDDGSVICSAMTQVQFHILTILLHANTSLTIKVTKVRIVGFPGNNS
jgi:hypothetical protein